MTERDQIRQEHISLRDYFESRIAALEKATEVARQSMDKRLDGMNEFREALKDQTNKFATRAEYDKFAGDIRELRETGAELRGKASQNSVLLAYAMSGIAIVVSIISLIKLFIK